jgi:hypothetical protein
MALTSWPRGSKEGGRNKELVPMAAWEQGVEGLSLAARTF